MVGMNSLVLVKLADWAGAAGVGNASNVLASPNNWKYLIFGLALILVVRLKPDGLLPPALQNANPLGIVRLVDGQPSREALA